MSSSLPGWGACLGIACAYVGSLYLWPNAAKLPRDHPKIIKRRFVSLAGTCAVAWVPLWRALRAFPPPDVVARALGISAQTSIASSGSLLRVLGMDAGSPLGAVTSIVSTLGLTAALFLGPLVALALDGELVQRFTAAARLDSIHKLRNLVVAPASEEFAFRSCMAPLLLYSGAASLRTAILATPLFFGVAHAHHFVELRRRTGRTSAALLAVTCQFTYTTLFGWFAAFAFMRTGHLAGPIASHAFCNVMGLPDVVGAVSHRRRGVIGVAYVVGIAAFVGGLSPATDPAWHPSSSWGDYAAIAREMRR
jgi:prenyl protein peptidase